jgi:hypothetical protein
MCVTCLADMSSNQLAVSSAVGQLKITEEDKVVSLNLDIPKAFLTGQLSVP